MSDRLEREIEDIVEKAGSLPPPPRRSRRAQRRRSTDSPRRSFMGGVKYAAVFGLVLLISGALLWGMSGSLGAALALGGLILLGAAYLSHFRNGSPSTLPGGYEKRWRGQSISSDRPQGPSLWDRIRGRRNRPHD